MSDLPSCRPSCRKTFGAILIALRMMTALFASFAILRSRGVAAATAATSAKSCAAALAGGSMGQQRQQCGIPSHQGLIDAAREAVSVESRRVAGAAPESSASNGDGNSPDDDDETKRSIRVAEAFLRPCCPEFLAAEVSRDTDRLVKIGRGLEDLLSREDAQLGASLNLLVEESRILASGNVTVPKVRFGRTEIQMPIVSLGTMRFQQAWGNKVERMDDVSPECQANVVNIIRYAAKIGVNHIEAARGYGSSEMQIGEALRVLFESGELRREDLIVQTKVPARETAAEFRELLERSFRELQVEYVDLFSFHGLNLDHQYDFLFNNKGNGNLIDVVKEYVAKGKIRHVGFSTHARPALIRRFIETGEFSYVNLHYHWCGSYTASGDGGGNLDIVRLMKEKDMGVFIISANDKGGMLYCPSKKLRSLTLPDMEPIAFGSHFLWEHKRFDAENAPVHTISCGAARPSDLDQPAIAAYLRTIDPKAVSNKVDAIISRLNAAQVAALGKDWISTWHIGLPNALDSSEAVQICNIVWFYNLIHSFGMIEFCRNRYASMENNSDKWDHDLSIEENIRNLGPSWGWTPGTAVKPIADFSDDLVNVPDENKARVLEAIEFVRKWCSKDSPSDATYPEEWERSYDMRPWTAFPERR